MKRLENFCQIYNYSIRTFEDFDNRFFTNFSNYLYNCSYQKGKEQKQYTQNTVINTLKVIKNLLHRAYDNEMTDNNYFTKVQTILSSDVSDQVYLTEKEILRLSQLKLTLPHEQNIRDMFVIACYTALRISDIQKLNNAEIRNGKIALYQTKTKEKVEIPILKEIAPLIAHYQKVKFPIINICKANETIKELAKRCGIDEQISQKEHRGGTTNIRTCPKWSMISFHTARRSCITNLYKRGYPVNYIMTLSGHRSIQAFQRYMKASSKEIMTSFTELLKKNHAL
jgi:integrase